jgi:intron-binding protein aquarius
MTCTHAAINRPNFIKWGFQYDNIIMEEAAQILEIETFVPMMLQVDDKEFGNRLKRVVLLGDHHQLPPVIKNRAFQKFCHMDQSLFTRFVRLGMPYIQLNAQGRMRSSLAKLWNWKYENLRDLPTVTHTPRFQQANAGLRHEFQLVDVGDYFGQGENSPQPNFVQNLAEAEYVVRTYMYMRLIGYPAEKISIITTYNGQKSLIRDVVARHCLNDPLFGAPAKITTVDKFQGQQNDFVLLSLVRTKLAGHIRDVRRLVVSMSRARLGLYVFCRKELYLNCYELASTFNVLTSKPSQLQLMPKERSTDGLSTERGVDTAVPEAEVTTVRDVEHMMGVVDELKNSIKAEWGLYHERVSAYEQKQREAAETRSRREQKAAEERRQSAVEEQEQQRKEAKAAEYDTQTEDFMEKTAQRVEQVEKQAMEEEDA